MQHKLTRSVGLCFVMLSLILLLPACAGPTPGMAKESSVVQAYNTTGMVPIPRYTRTIFSTTDF